jgi:PAS domain-containing protein
MLMHPAKSSLKPRRSLSRNDAPDEEPAEAPALFFDVEGIIRHMSTAARRLLAYEDEEPFDICFFSLVDQKNLYTVLRDVAEMACYGKRETRWLLRLHTADDRWRWVKAHAENQFDAAGGVRVVLSEA